MVVSYDEPHHPFTCPVEYLEKYADFYYDLGEKAQDDLANKPEHHRLWAQAMPSPVGDDGLYHHPLYFACNDFVDEARHHRLAMASPAPISGRCV